MAGDNGVYSLHIAGVTGSSPVPPTNSIKALDMENTGDESPNEPPIYITWLGGIVELKPLRYKIETRNDGQWCVGEYSSVGPFESVGEAMVAIRKLGGVYDATLSPSTFSTKVE